MPSGLLWCKHNIGATKPEDEGLYFAWGETTGYVDAAARNTALGRSDGFSSDAYTATGGAAITDSVLTWAHDAAAQIMGGDWRMPTDVEFAELINNCNTQQITIKGTLCLKFTSNINGNTVIFPEIHYCKGNVFESEGRSNYFSSTKVDNDYAKYMYVNNSLSKQGTYGDRWVGYNIRPVREAPKAIDLDLPSGTLWADRNVGATAPEEDGLYFAWGETEGYKDAADRNAKLTAETGTTYTGGFDTTSYNRPGGASGISANLSGNNDAATVNFGGNWRMPTLDEIQELLDNTNISVVTENNVRCVRFESKTDSTKAILIPLCGTSDENGRFNIGGASACWSSTYYHRDYAELLSLNSLVQNVMAKMGTRKYGRNVRAVQ